MPRKIDIVPFGDNDLTSDYLFTQREYYVANPEVYPQEDLPKPVDMWYNKPYWGKVDTKQRLIIPDPDALLPISGELEVINFVADAYFSFRNFVLDATSKFRTSMSSFIDFDNPKKAHQDTILDYKNYFENTLEPGFINTFLSEKDKSEIENFEDYASEYILFVDVNPDIPHTLAGFISSPLVSYRHSGMIIEFATDDYDDDGNKWDNFLSNDFFDDYVRIAASFGFYVSKHVPWAIAANLNSQRMRQYMTNYGVTNIANNFNLNFLQAEFISFESFKKYMYLAYSSFITYRPRTERVIYNNCIKQRISDSSFKTIREIYFRPLELNFLAPNYQEFTRIYSDIFLLKIYVKIRLKEEKILLNKRQQEILMINIYKTKGDIYNKIDTLSKYIASQRKNRFNKLTRKTKSVSMTEEIAPASSYFSGMDGSGGGGGTTGY